MSVFVAALLFCSGFGIGAILGDWLGRTGRP